MSSDGNHMTRLGGVKQEIQDFKTGFESSVNEIKHSIDSKFNNINDHLKDIKENFTNSVHDIVNESKSKVKDSIIEALREENMKLQTKCENLEARLFELRKVLNKQDQYSWRNNLEIHGIPVEVKNNQLKEKVIDIFSQLNISLSKSDIEDCHPLGKSNTIARFVNETFCKDALEKKIDVNKHIDNSKFGFNDEKKIFVCENLTPYNQCLAWMCRELKRGNL